ncbi:hypothetical protein F5Y18DRAFT_428124 [Xylariaceae sp. FL1019]|nr:hypothetical protein F5Y18DRAFT_428124 [Xylariaceae sp. FL1019]
MTSPEKSPNKASTTKGTTLKTTTLSSVMTPSVMTVTKPATPAAPDKTLTTSVMTSIESLKTSLKPAIAATVETSLKPTSVATIHPARPSPDSLDAGKVLTVDTTCNGNLKKAEDPDVVTLRDLLTPKAHGQDHLDSAPRRHPLRPGDTRDGPNTALLRRFLALRRA